MLDAELVNHGDQRNCANKYSKDRKTPVTIDGLPSGSALGRDTIAARNPTAAHDAMYLRLVYNRNMIAEGAQAKSK